MNLFSQKKDGDKVRFRAIMQSGLFVDEMADVVQTQVIAQKARASINNRKTVPFFDLTGEWQYPAFRESGIVETGLAPPPGSDSMYTLVHSKNLHEGIRSGAVEVDPEKDTKTHRRALMALAVSAIIFIACAWVSGLSSRPSTPAAAVVQEVQETGERVSYGTVESLAGPQNEAGDTQSGAADGAVETGDGGEDGAGSVGIGESAESGRNGEVAGGREDTEGR